MKVVFLAAGNSVHTVKWVNEFAHRGHDVHLITLHPPERDPVCKRVKIHTLPFAPPSGYYLNAPILRRLLREIKPDIVNAHHAAGYGTLARLSGFHPILLSVWGSDVFDFPMKSPLHRSLIRKNLRIADQIASTSHVMKRQVERLIDPSCPIEVIPFGVDCEIFQPTRRERHAENEPIRIGTVKTLAPKYGIDYLIRAFAIIRKRLPRRARLIIAGDGPQREQLQRLTDSLGVTGDVEFLGRVPHAIVPEVLNSLDIFAALSTFESFGVAVVEASACELPVVVSNVGGLPEVVCDGVTGFVVPPRDPESAAEKIMELMSDRELRHVMGKNGRKFVLSQYDWKVCADKMEQVMKRVAKMNS